MLVGLVELKKLNQNIMDFKEDQIVRIQGFSKAGYQGMKGLYCISKI